MALERRNGGVRLHLVREDTADTAMRFGQIGIKPHRCECQLVGSVKDVAIEKITVQRECPGRAECARQDGVGPGIVFVDGK